MKVAGMKRNAWLRYPGIIPAILVLTGVLALSGFAQTRDAILESAIAHWRFGEGVDGLVPPLTPVGNIEYQVDASGSGAITGAQVARLTNAYFDAGTTLNMTGTQMTVYLRVRDPLGQWNYALFAKRGSHTLVNFNLFSVDLAGTTGNDIGFEIRTDQGFVMVSFPISQIQPAAWLDLIGRYDGNKIELICNDRVMASQAWSGSLNTNSEPLLIGAETNNSNITRLFTGEMEEAALWSRALTNQEVISLVRAGRLIAPPGPILHYKHPSHAVGDVHPFFIDGVYYVNYLYNPGTWNIAQLRSTDLLRWEHHSLHHTPPSDGQLLPNYFVLDVIYDPFLEKYRTFYGYVGTRTSLSDDLVNWDFGTPHLVLPDRTWLYSRQSDPYVFYNDTTQNYWMVQTLRKINLPHNQAGAIGYAVSSDLVTWTWLGELYYPGNVGDPECPSMFRMGSKWYLLASFYDRSVGKPSYRISDSPYGPWTTPYPDSLDGKDVCAAISCHDGKQRLLFGWIPLTASQPGSQYWGGHLAFPREVYQLVDGTLGTRLEDSISWRIRAEQHFPGTTIQLISRSGIWQISGDQAQYPNAVGYGVATFSDTFERVDFEVNLTAGNGFQRAGIILNWASGNPGFEIGIDEANSRFIIWTPGGTIHSQLPITLTPGQPMNLRVIQEEDIIEAFLADRYSLAARIPVKLQATSVGLFAANTPVTFNQVSLYRLKSLDEIEDDFLSVPCWETY